MIVTHEIRVDLLRPGLEPRIYAVQDDKYSRDLRLSLFAAGVSWKIPDGTSALVRYRKPDGTGGTYDTLPDGTTAWSAVDNVLTVALAPQVLTVAGPVYLAVTLIKGKQQITTFSVLLHVQPDVSANVGESENYINVAGFLPAPQSAKIGQFVRVAAVNENGNVTAVETVDAVGGAVQSVNGQTGTVTLTAEKVGADASGTAAGIVSSHNTNTTAHNDMRIELKALADRLNAFFDSDDTTLDELSEIVEYIKSNKSLIEAVTTSKVNVVDIIDDLTTNVSNKPLSAAQGVVLKGLIDDISREGNEILIYGYSDAATIRIAILSGRPVYCLYEHQYYIPLISWNEETETAVFNNSFVQCKAVAGEWSGNPVTEDSIEPEMFVGNENTTVAEFNEAFASRKPCFMMRANAGAGITMWVAYSCGTNLAYFYRIAPDGTIQYGTLDSEKAFTVQEKPHVTTIDQNSTDSQIPTAKAVYDLVKTKGSGIYVLSEGENLEDVPENATVVVDPYGEPDMSVEQVVAAALEVIENGTY